MSTLRALWLLLSARERRRFIALGIMALVMALTTVVGLAAVVPFFAVLGDPALVERSASLAAFERLLGIPGRDGFLIVLGCGFIVLLVIANTVNLGGTWLMSRFAWRIGDRFRVALFDRYLRRDFLFHARSGAARLASAVLHEADRVTGMLQSAFVLLTNAIVILLIVISIALVNAAVAGVMLLLFVSSYALVYGVARDRLFANGRAQTRAGADRVAVVDQGLGAIKDLLLSHRQSGFVGRFAEACATISRAASSTQLIGQFPRHLIEAIAGVGLVAAALLLGAGRGASPWLAQLTFIAFASYRLLPAVQQCYFALVTIRAARPAFDGIAVDLAAAHVPSADETAAVVGQFRDCPAECIELVDVSFRYSHGAARAVDSVSLRIPAHATIGFVGRNGAGKTTLVDLLLGLLEPETGRIEVDGIPIGAHNVRAWQQRVAYVPQQIFILDGTVRENIAFGVGPDSVDEARLREAAFLAGAAQFVDSLPRKFDERLGDRGMRLSGGQRQRLGIARALYRSPALLVLDEATSSLDVEAEAALGDALQRLQGRVTIIVIAHRAAAVRDCSVVHELAAGRIVASRKRGEFGRAATEARSLAPGPA